MSYAREALSWVNDLRQYMGNPPVNDFPKSIPGDGENCLLARAIKLGTYNVGRVQISGDSWHVAWTRKETRLEPMPPVFVHPNSCIKPEDVMTCTVPRHMEEQGELPRACKKLVRAFDGGDPSLDAYRSNEPRRGVVEAHKHMHGQMMQKMHESLFNPLADFKPKFSPAPAPTPDWAKMFETPEAPVKAPTEEPELA